jgi:hypothetical protein
MGVGSTASGAIHSAIYYELLAGTPQYILYGQGTSISRFRLSDGATTFLGAMSSANPWGFYRANGRIFWNDGVTGLQSYDGATLRTAGIRAPTAGEVSGIVVSASAGGGSFNTTVLSGYTFYLSYQNPNTQHVGNRTLINATPLAIPGGGYSIVFTGLPNLSGVNPEWVKVIGRSPDGGQVPYWMTDANQNNIIVGNTATTATYTSTNVNFNEELPTRNTVPPTGLTMFCKVLGRVFAATGVDLFIYYTEAEEDVVSGIFVGRPEESWPGDNAEAYPTGGVPTCLACYNNLGWFFSRYHLLQWSESLRQSISDPWLGPWPIGCAGKRAFVETKYGPFWVSGTKRLMTFGPFGPVPVSPEYERALLSKISDANLALTEIAYFEDQVNEIDRIEVFGLDSNNNPVIVIHDFNLREEGENFYLYPGAGQGYTRSYTGMTLNTFVRQTEAITYVRDTSNRLRLWAGDTSGKFRQLEDGTSDSGSTYSADYIGLLSLGAHDPRIPEINWFGDGNVNFSYYTGADMDSALSKFKPSQTEQLRAEANLWSASVGDQGSFLYYRFQLTAHPADGNFDITDPPNTPMNTYGVIFGVRFKEGSKREEGRR